MIPKQCVSPKKKLSGFFSIYNKPQINTVSLTFHQEYKFAIKTEWNGAPIDHVPITFQISAQDDFVRINVSGPFFDDPDSPPCKVGSACDGLWDYEGKTLLLCHGGRL